MALNITDKINSHPMFLHRQNRFFNTPLHRLLCNALIKPLFNYGCTNLDSKSSTKKKQKKLKLRLRVTQNKCISFCLQLNKMSRICVKEFLELNWLNVPHRYLQFIVSDIFKYYNDIFKYYNNQCPDHFNEVFCTIDDN